MARLAASPRVVTRARITALTLVVALHVALFVALLRPWGAPLSALQPEALAVLTLAPPPMPPPRRDPPRAPSPRRPDPREAPAPPNRLQEPTEIVLPPPVVLLPQPPAIAVAPIAGIGNAPDAGAAATPGPGTGAGGEGSGRGGGGEGRGGKLDHYSPPRQVRGRLRNSDFPRVPAEAGIGGRVGVRYLVGVSGRVESCEVTRSSGNAELDATTCRLITERFVFRPSRNGRGEAVPSYIVENHSWIVEDAGPHAQR